MNVKEQWRGGQEQPWSCDSVTGDLYENGKHVGKLTTGNSGAWWRLITQASEYQRLREIPKPAVSANLNQPLA